jgi:chromosome segregation ATPase
MTEEPNSPLNQALSGLGTTIQSITGKVEAGKNRVREYKIQIITKLKEVVQQLNSLKENNNLKALPQLRKQLQDSQVTLQEKTEELDKTKSNLDKANQELDTLRKNIALINDDLEKKNKQINDLTNSVGEKDNQITELNGQITDLNKKKEEAERQFASAQKETDSLIQRIGNINATLGTQIELIDTIANELGDLGSDSDDVAIQFKAVGDNIMAIMNMINNPSESNSSASASVNAANVSGLPLYDKFMKLNDDQKEQIYRELDNNNRDNKYRNIIVNNITSNTPQDKINIQNILSKIYRGNLLQGGRRKRKTRKMRHKKTKKTYKGGYVYSSNKNLDKSSSVISSSTTPSSKKHSSKRHSSSTRKSN